MYIYIVSPLVSKLLNNERTRYVKRTDTLLKLLLGCSLGIPAQVAKKLLVRVTLG